MIQDAQLDSLLSTLLDPSPGKREKMTITQNAIQYWMSSSNAGGGGVHPSKVPVFYLQVSPSANIAEVGGWIRWANEYFSTLPTIPNTYTFSTAIRQGHNDWLVACFFKKVASIDSSTARYRTQMRYLRDHWRSVAPHGSKDRVLDDFSLVNIVLTVRLAQ